MTIIQALKKLFGLDGDYGTIAAALDDAEIDSGLPAVTSDDNGDILKVVEGAWAKGDPPTGLPAVTTDDNMKILAVASGAWGKSTNILISDEADINLFSGLGTYTVLAKSPSGTSFRPQKITVIGKSGGANKHLISDSTGTWQIQNFPLPKPTAADAGKIVKVNSAGDGYELVSA